MNRLFIEFYLDEDVSTLVADLIKAGLKHYGLVIAVQRPAHELARRLLVIMDRVTADEIEDQILYV